MIRFFSIATAKRFLPPLYWPLFILLGLYGPLITTAPRGTPVLLIALALASGYILIREKRWQWPPGIWAGLIAVFIALAGVSILGSPSWRAGIVGLELGYITLSALLIWNALRGLSADTRWALQFALIMGAGIGWLLWGFETSLGHPLHRWAMGMDFSAPLWPNVPKRTETLLALFVWPLGFILWRRGLPWPALVLPFFLLLIFLTTGSSRSAMVGLGAGVLAALIAAFTPNKLRAGLLGLVAASFILLPVGASVIRTIPKTEVAFLFPSAIERLEIWSYTGDDIRQEPILGHGLDATRALGPQLTGPSPGATTDPNIWRDVPAAHPHNAILQLWAELGALGVLPLLFLFAGLLRAIGTLERAGQIYALGGLATGGLMLLTAYGLWQAWWLSGHVLTALFFLLITPKTEYLGPKGRARHAANDADR